MLKNYLLTAWRNFWRNRTFSLINTAGLALGMTCSLLIMLWIQDERSIDKFHANKENLYSVFERQYYDGKIEAFHGTPGLLAEEMKKVLPDVKYAANMSWSDEVAFAVGNRIIKQEGIAAGKDLFNIFSFPLIMGKPETALNSPVSIAISRKMANSLFGSPEQAFGKTVRFQDEKDLKVTAVYEDIGFNSSIKADYFLNWEYFQEKESWTKNWGNNGPRALIVLKDGTDPVKFDRKITRFLDNYNKEQGPNFRIELGIQRFNDIYLNGKFKNGKIAGGRIEYVRLFSIVAIFIIVIACINFMNLTTARAVKRSKEIGIRKVVGAVRAAEQTVNSLSGYFAFLAIFISCLGLLGLTIFTAEQRIREMGIRKVLGASIASIFTLLSKEFLILVSIALLIAFPLAWWIMNDWLQDFTYHININAWVFIIAALISLIIAFSTISVHAIKAALMNPVKSLRTE